VFSSGPLTARKAWRPWSVSREGQQSCEGSGAGEEALNGDLISLSNNLKGDCGEVEVSLYSQLKDKRESPQVMPGEVQVGY